ncbi:deaminase domain-containing protein [Chitinophaga pinensis]|uniref:Uncharacterized protein n=1 Tax=Chitinophaga pinensis TaxID=79329 RepID=A0A5C6LN95_9BACT|nr:deaminase domain-containing protein [Chitinophaga pinensis]TWV95694.1 hypothetical protein FEF09_23970 [Chitinophaga pinensis]
MDNKFWDTLTKKASPYVVFDQVKNDPALHLQTIAVDKRAIGLEILTESFNAGVVVVPHDNELYLKLLTSFKGAADQTALLEYIEENMKFGGVYAPFNRFLKPRKMQVATMMAYSNMITASGHCNYLVEEKAEQMAHKKVIAKLEGNMLQFDNAGIDFPKDGNTMYIDDIPYQYNDIVAVEVAGSFTITIDGKPKTFPQGTILNIPALQLGMMSEINTADVAQNTMWLAVDIGTMAIGIGEAKVLFSAGNYVRKTIVAMDIIGSSVGMGLQLLDADAISPELRTSLQIACFITSVPNMALAIPKIDNVVKDLDVVINTKYGKSGLTAKEAKELETLRAVREKLHSSANLSDLAEDGAEITNRAVTISGNDNVKNVTEWLKKAEGSDNNLYLVVHATENGEAFSVIHKGEEIVMSHRSLANWIRANEKNFPADKQLVLLSCTNIETAQNLSRKLKRSVVANDGPVRVYSNGVIDADNGFRYIDEAGNIDNTGAIAVGRQGPVLSEKEMVQLGAKSSKALTAAELVIEFERRFKIGNELALKLSKNADFVKAYEADARIFEVIEKWLPDLEVTVKDRKFETYREALLSACADDPKLFTKMNTSINEAIDIIANAENVTAFERFSDARKVMTEYMADAAGLNKDFFANGVLNSAVFRYAPLDGNGWGKIDKARRDFNIPDNKNVLVVRREMENGENFDEVAHSGFLGEGKGGQSAAGTIEKVSTGNFGQFKVGIHRLQDSESKYFEYLLQMIKDDKLKATEIKQLILYTERPVCPSCLNIINQFQKDHKVKIIVYEGKYRR